MGIGESLRLTAFYITIALLFGAWVWAEKGADFGMAWYTGFFIEKALSIDNVFVIGLIFGTFAIREVPVPRAAVGHHRRDRAARRDDRGGAALVSEAYWVLYLSPPS
jgi:tellurite resistance protein TerC